MVQDALVSAHKTAREVVAQAEKEAEAARTRSGREAEEIVDNARARARDVVAEATVRREQAEKDVTQLEMLARGIREEYRDFVERAIATLEAHEATATETVVEMQDALVAAARSAPES